MNDVAGMGFAFEHILLPLGISFITFQKIAFLADVYSGRVQSFSFRSFSLFVFFFPQLIAGPIVHYREMMPQFEKTTGRVSSQDLAVGGGLFFCGLFKKVILADGIAFHISPIFAAAANGDEITFIYAWIATVGFTLQVYFDFSGYSEMALGAARCFGIRLPVNFNSPLRATSIIDFWGRWHVTLVRFLTAYVFSPLAFALTRRRLERGKASLAGADTSWSAFLSILMLPTMITMILSGLWHGAGYGFIVWGLLHGFYLIVNHGWNLYRPRFWPDERSHARIMKPIGFLLTFAAVVYAMAFFRATTIDAGLMLSKAMFGFNGVSVPVAIGNLLGGWLPPGITLEWTSGKSFVLAIAWIVCLLAIAWLSPNTLQIFRRYEPALDFTPDPAACDDHDKGRLARLVDTVSTWRLSARWAVVTGLTASIGILALGQPTVFLYWQF